MIIQKVEDYNRETWNTTGDIALIFLNNRYEFRKSGYVASYKNSHCFGKTKKEAIARLNKANGI
jgi:hypothetical protein